MISPVDGHHKGSRRSSSHRRGMDSLPGAMEPLLLRRMVKLRLPRGRMDRNPGERVLMEYQRRRGMELQDRAPRAMAHPPRAMEYRVQRQGDTELLQRMEHRVAMALREVTEEAMDSLSSIRLSRHIQRQAAQDFLPGQIRKW